MREEQKILNHHINIDGKDGNADILQQLQGVTKQRVDQLDYQQQIERWNRYQELLDEIDKRCGTHVGVRLDRNVKHNFRVFTDVSYAGLSVIGMVALMGLWGSFSTNSIYGIIGSITALGFVGWQTLIRLYHPSIILFKCSPVLHIDEFAYMRQAIRAIPPAERDPIVRLPVLEMSVSRAWLAQQGMLKFMESLGNIKLDNAMDEKNQQRQQ
jgi:hypothetical protein